MKRVRHWLRIQTDCENCYGAGCGWCMTAFDWM